MEAIPDRKRGRAWQLTSAKELIVYRPSQATAKAAGEQPQPLSQTSTAEAAPISTSAEASRLSAEVQRTKEQARRILAIQEQLDDIKVEKASFGDGETLPPTLIEAGKELTLQLGLADPRILEAANDSRLCKAEAHRAEKVRLGGLANSACQEYTVAGVIQQTTGEAAAAAREDVVQKKAASLTIMVAQKRLVVDFNDPQRAHDARAKAQLPPICIGPSPKKLPGYRSSTLEGLPPTERGPQGADASSGSPVSLDREAWVAGVISGAIRSVLAKFTDTAAVPPDTSGATDTAAEPSLPTDTVPLDVDSSSESEEPDPANAIRTGGGMC